MMIREIILLLEINDQFTECNTTVISKICLEEKIFEISTKYLVMEKLFSWEENDLHGKYFSKTSVESKTEKYEENKLVVVFCSFFVEEIIASS